MNEIQLFLSKNLNETSTSFLQRIFKSIYHDDFIQIGTNIFGKKYLCHPHKNIQISIAHNEQLMAVALSDTVIGIDIEMLNVIISKNDLNYVFAGRNRIILNNLEADKLVYLWTGTEAFLKCFGLGFLLGTDFFSFAPDLTYVSLDERDEKYYFSYPQVDSENCIALCSKNKITDVEVTYLA